MAKITIYVPEQMREAMKIAESRMPESCNWSRLAQETFERHLCKLMYENLTRKGNDETKEYGPEIRGNTGSPHGAVRS